MHIDAPNQTEAITETTPDIDLALGDAHFPSLHMALLQITRDESLFHEQYADTGLLRRTALDIITDLRDGKRTVNTELPDAEFVHTMMQHMAGGNVPEEYVPMMMQEMSLLEPEPWYEDIPAETRGKLKVAVIGAGMSGILTAIRLQEAGIPFVVFEKIERWVVPGLRTATQDAGSTFPIIFTVTLLRPTTAGHHISRSGTNCWTTLSLLSISMT